MTICPLICEKIVKFMVLNAGIGEIEAYALTANGLASYEDKLLTFEYSHSNGSVSRDTYEFCNHGIIMIRSERKSSSGEQWRLVSPI